MEDKNRPDSAAVRFRDSIRWKLEITIVGIIVALVVILTMLQISSQQQSLQKALSTHSSFLREEMIAKADKAATRLSGKIQAMISPFRVASVNTYVLDVVRDIDDLQYIILMQGTVPRVAHGTNLSGDLRRKILSGDVSAFTARQREVMKHEFVVGGHAFMESVVPIQLEGEHWGVLRLGFSLDHLNKTLADSQAFINEEIRGGVIRASMTALLFLIVATIAVFLLTSRWISPIRRLVAFSHELAGGNFSAKPHISVRTNDEIGVLTASLEEMAASLEASYAKLEEYSHTLEHKVEKRTSELAAARDRAIQADRSKSEFLSNMSHEIRTPMNAIIGLSHLMLDSRMDRQQRDYQMKIHTAAQSLLVIINDILDFSKIEAGKLRMEKVAFELEDVFDKLAGVMAAEAEKKGLTLSFGHPSGLPTLVGDPLRLEQVLLNLVSNAVKFTEQGQVSVDVETLARNQSDVRLCFHVRDTGIGISEQEQKNLFQPFSQADASTTRKYGGTGLGLAISKQLVEMMGGEVAVDSRVGEGSCFSVTIRFPIGESVAEPSSSQGEGKPDAGQAEVALAAAAEAAPAMPLPEVTADLRGIRLLVAEDNEINQLVVEGLLSRVGIDFRMVSNGEEALQAIRQQDYDAVIMDMQMPLMGGLEATRIIRQEPRFSHVPIIAMTANAMQGDREKCLGAGMNDYIAKPVDPEVMYAVLRRWLRPAATVVQSRQHGRGAPAAEVAMPELAGIDVDDGLMRAGGDRQLYGRMLNRFLGGHAGDGKRLKEALARGEPLTAQHLAHNLKSVSGNVGARLVQQRAGEVESAIRQGDEVDEMMLSRLQQALAEVVETLAAWRQSQPEPEAATIPGEGVAVASVISRMRDMLSDYDSHALELLEELKEAMQSRADSASFRRLQMLIEKYDFDAALAALAQLENEINGGGGHG